jgi:long-chain acyl-CoA synthetase
LDAEDAMFFHRMGVAVYQGYGLTETSPVVTMNSPRANRFGSVGRPLHGVEVRIVTDSPGDAGRPVHRTGAPASTEGDGASGCEQGEILVRGPNVMLGYYRDPVATKAVISPDGWLHTGDVGYMDGDGFLHISGRSKNVIVLPNGKNVQPEEVEAALERLESVREACVFAGVGDHGLTAGTEQVQAVVVPSDALLGRGLSEGAVISLLEEEVRNAVRTLAAYKHPTRITVSFHELPKTATRKVQRSRVAACYR